MDDLNLIKYPGFTKKYTSQRLNIALRTNTEQSENQDKVEKMTFKSILKKIRIVRWLLALRRMPRLIAELNEKIDGLNGKVDIANQKLDSLLQERIQPVIFATTSGITVVQAKEFLFAIPAQELRLAAYLSKYGYFEKGTEVLFKKFIESGMNIVDVGANLGIYTLHAAKGGANVYAYEPTPFIYNLLKENIELNGFTGSNRVRTFNTAVGEKDGETAFTVYKELNGHNTMFPTGADGEEITVPVVSLDSHLPAGISVDIVKIDVEGSEWLVLKGMQRIISENPDIKIFMEFATVHLERARFNPNDFLSDIRKMGFEIYVIDDFTGELTKKTDEEIIKIYCNNLLLSKKIENMSVI
jgi:FkbM family methyltransferase